jgi:Zn-dependent protease with chaperone function
MYADSHGRKFGAALGLLWLLLAFCTTAQADDKTALARARQTIEEIRAASYPELAGAKIEVKTFHSASDYFQSRFSFGRFLTFRRMRYVVFVNPAVYDKNCPPEAVRAIVAHELAHIVYYRQRNRLELFGLVRLAGDGFTARFERGADVEALARGYGTGLKMYREWLYQNIPPHAVATKKRRYFTPDEIDAALEALQTRPALIEQWRQRPPRHLSEIEAR